MRLIILDDASGRIELHLAISKNIELLNDLLRIAARGQMDKNLNRVGGVIVDVFNLNLALSIGGENRLD